jgi:HlyD family secretion protein
MKRPSVHAALLALTVALAACERRDEPAPPPDETVSRGDLTYSVEVGGRLVPREEIFVRPLVSGLLAEVRVRPGQRVTKGHHLATVRIVADPVLLAEARAAERRAQASVASATRELARVRAIEGGSGIAAREIAQAEDHERVARNELEAAQERARLLAEGVAAAGRPGEAGARSTHVLTPVDGTVLAVPVAVGDFVSESSTYRDGTAIAILADMQALMFKGFVEEAHVGRLSVGMPARVRIGALGGSELPGTLRWIAPRASIEVQPGTAPVLPSGQPALTPLTASTAGSTRFELWIDVQAPEDAPVRAGYTAAAELVLEHKQGVLNVPESALRFEGGKCYADVRSGLASEERVVTLGISDGVRVEVLSGLKEGEKLVPPASK